jgi:hypothetical protein
MTIAGKNSLPGESPGDKLCRIVRSYVGCSLKVRRSELAALVARGVDDPESVVTISTNCGMFALGVMAEAGVDDPLLDRKYVTGMAIAWLRQIGLNRKALVRYTGPHGPQPSAGSLLRYETPSKNDDHVEWLLSSLDAQGGGSHAGGGRPDNAITLVERGIVTSSLGRPLVEFWDPNLLGIETLLPTSDANEAYPDA